MNMLAGAGSSRRRDPAMEKEEKDEKNS